MEIESLESLDLRVKPISREALAKIVEVSFTGFTCVGELGRQVALDIRKDDSFDVVIPRNPIYGNETAKLFRFKGKIPMFNSYCRNPVLQGLELLPYTKEVLALEFPHIIYLQERISSHNL
jgi:hypothetical protein